MPFHLRDFIQTFIDKPKTTYEAKAPRLVSTAYRKKKKRFEGSGEERDTNTVQRAPRTQGRCNIDEMTGFFIGRGYM